MSAQMVPPPEPAPESFEIDAEVRYADALSAALVQGWRRAPGALAVYCIAVPCLLAAAWLSSGALAWLAVIVGAPGVAAVAAVAWLTRQDFRRSGGKPQRMRYHVCASGIEVSAARRSDWIAWDDLWDAGETRRSFLLRPSPGEQYVIPKRCCRDGAAAGLRAALVKGGALAGRD